MRKIIQVIVIILAIVYVVVSFTQIQTIIETLRMGNFPFLLVAFLFELLCLFNATAVYGSLFQLVGLKETRWNLFLMTTASTFVSMIAPSGGMSGMAVFIDSAKSRKLSSGRVLVVGILYLLYEYASLLCVVTVGFIVLIRRGHLSAGEVSAAIFMLAIAIADAVVLYLGYKSQRRLGKLLVNLSKFVNHLLFRFFHRDLLNVENAYNLSVEIAEGIKTIRGKPDKLVWPFLFALNNKAILLFVLAFTFMSLDVPFSVGTIIGGFSLVQLFFYVSPTPGGVGVVEGVFPLILDALGVPFGKAMLITLTYRGITLWFPLLIGFFSFRLLQQKNERKQQYSEE
jgi:glycosyltransferase 2 family protein